MTFINRIYFVLFLLTALTISGCDSKRVFEKNTDIKDYNWNNNAALMFDVTIQDTIALHNMYVNVRNAGYYRFSNLFLFMIRSLIILHSKKKDIIKRN